jgi:pimeloyl-ACP methyl ester carboxylesterase
MSVPATHAHDEAPLPVLTPAEWHATGQHFGYHGQRIFFRDEGPREAPALLLIHGFPTASWDFAALWPHLARRWRMIALDMIGFGFSAKPRGHDYRIAEQADIHQALLRELGVDAFDVLAHDYGDTVAQELLARHLEAPQPSPRLRSVCFLNGGLFPETHRPALVQKLLLTPLLGRLVAALTGRRAFDRNMRRIFGAATPPSALHLDGFWSLLNHNDGRAALPGLIRYIPERVAQRARWVGALQQSPLPLQLICGAADPISGAHMASRYRELVPAADVTLLAQIGHYPQVEAPQAVLDAYLRFRGATIRAAR